MRIQNTNINKMLNVYANQSNVDKTKKSEAVKKSDQFNISSVARDFQVAMQEVKKQPEVREERVATIKQQIASGTYRVDAKKIAEKMMQDANVYTRL